VQAGPEWILKFTQYILKQSYDYNPAFILALSLAQFKHYRERSYKTVEFLIKLIKNSLNHRSEGDEENYLRFANIQDRLGRCSLHIACQFDSVALVQDLINCGADFRMQDIEGQTPLHYAVNCDN